MPAVALHRRRPAPVGAHDELVARAGGQERAHLEGQVLALVAGDLLAVEEDPRAVVDRLEAQRVVAVDRHVDVGPVPADRAAEVGDAAHAADLRGVRDEGDADELAAERARLKALLEAGVAAVAAKAPQPAELRAVAGARVDRRLAAVRKEHGGRGGRGVGFGRGDHDEDAREHGKAGTDTADHRPHPQPRHSTPFIVHLKICGGCARNQRVQARASVPLCTRRPAECTVPRRSARRPARRVRPVRAPHGPPIRHHRRAPRRLDRAPRAVLRRHRAASRRRPRQRVAEGADRLVARARAARRWPTSTSTAAGRRRSRIFVRTAESS